MMTRKTNWTDDADASGDGHSRDGHSTGGPPSPR